MVLLVDKVEVAVGKIAERTTSVHGNTLWRLKRKLLSLNSQTENLHMLLTAMTWRSGFCSWNRLNNVSGMDAEVIYKLQNT